ncbi:SRPBCC family protein [Pseudomonas sp. RTC3]|uniref:SRPBCC family protein n=1 Tax=unclassified Pseudomonas TaxID=196821 RepID=UPI002AB54498|nr:MULTISPECIES: SRPBCC family protein [unclassified Pseudomonas]MEB0065146.1 SRPBCC family protein [Pseudomonas sp. RTC3]MDY7567362.1 SRPBCC family protein [Pseudomonas sp. 5C2]MEB0009561.1 SRPBCC family protein [Pseudomonas sp. RTB2]MEB0019892.1 SRPBCC family protein [Pseudomonas sp. RTB3]MEB0029043.1 SRPBCC family protein [Pseudomonas sp. MH9.2]
MNTLNTLENLQPDTLIRNPESCRVVSAVEVASHARSVWGIVGNFAGFPAFIPALDACEMTGSGVRSIRKKLFKDGNVVVEQLNSRDDDARYMTWSLIYTTLPIGNLWASMTVAEQGDDQCRATWTIVGEPSSDWPDSLPAFQAFLQAFADDAMNNVRTMFA